MVDMPHTGSSLISGTGITGSGSVFDWPSIDALWHSRFPDLSYLSEDRGYDFYRPAFRYGTEAAAARGRRSWEEVEPDLRAGWETYEHRGECTAPWEEMSPAVLDAWTHYCEREELLRRREES